ncbi:hypothetical protein TNCV_2198901 [Trichonephila clavipes]|nr:hypothetical protein TNCV_2198901 [Trichonephila clavipes]
MGVPSSNAIYSIGSFGKLGISRQLSSRYKSELRTISDKNVKATSRRRILVVRASDSRLEGLGSKLPNTLPVHTEYVLIKSVGPKSGGLNHEYRALENIFLPFSSMSKLWR